MSKPKEIVSFVYPTQLAWAVGAVFGRVRDVKVWVEEEHRGRRRVVHVDSFQYNGLQIGARPPEVTCVPVQDTALAMALSAASIRPDKRVLYVTRLP